MALQSLLVLGGSLVLRRLVPSLALQFLGLGPVVLEQLVPRSVVLPFLVRTVALRRLVLGHLVS